LTDLLDRKPHAEASAGAWAVVETGAEKAKGTTVCDPQRVPVAAVNRGVIQEALQFVLF